MRLIIAILIWLVPLAFVAPDAEAFVQKKPQQRNAQRKARPAQAKPRGTRPARGTANSLERWRRMSPKQRQQYLQKLPPDRRRALQQRMNRLEKLPPQQRQRLQRDYRQFQRMTPRQQNDFRRLYQKFNKLPADRRPMMLQEYRRMRGLTSEQRKDRMESKAFQKRFRSGERKLLEDMSKTLPEPEAPAGRE